MSIDELLTRLDNARATYDDASAQLSDTIKRAQKVRDELFRTREPWVGWEATALVDRLMTARYHTMGVVQELKACARVAERNLAEAVPAVPAEQEQTKPAAVVSSAHLFARMAVGIGAAVFGIVAVVFESLDKPWISDRTWGVVFSVTTVFYVLSFVLGTARERRATLRGLAVAGAFFLSLSLTRRVTGWSSDNWRTGVVAAAVLLATGALAYALRRRATAR